MSKYFDAVLTLTNLCILFWLCFFIVEKATTSVYLMPMLYFFGVAAVWVAYQYSKSVIATLFLTLFYIVILPSSESSELTYGGIAAAAMLLFCSTQVYHLAYKHVYWLRVFLMGVFGLVFFEVIYYQVFSVGFDQSAIHAVMQSHSAEGWYFFVSTFNAYNMLSWLFLLLFVFFFLKASKTKATPHFAGWVSLLIILPTLLFLPVSQKIYSGFHSYQHEISMWKKQKLLREQKGLKTFDHRPDSNELHIVVIGESATKRHMSLYGYDKQTTPFLQNKSGLLVFSDFISTHSHTVPSLSEMLTAKRLADTASANEFPSIIEVAANTGYKTFWLSNQRRMGSWDSGVSIMADASNDQYFINHLVGKGSFSKTLDGDLLPVLENVLSQKTEGDSLVFLHLNGSHSVYKVRYPESFAFFDESNEINAYDNSIRYTDWVLNEVYSLSEKYNVSSVSYFSDHGEDVVRDLSHNSSVMTKTMVEIPFIVWFSEKFKADNPQVYLDFKSNVDSAFSADVVFYFLTYMLGVSMTEQESPGIATLSTKNRRVKGGKLSYKELPD